MFSPHRDNLNSLNSDQEQVQQRQPGESEIVATSQAEPIKSYLGNNENVEKLKELFPDIAAGTHGLDDSYLSDLVKIQQLILDQEKMVDLLRPLDKKLSELKDSEGKLPSHALSDLLGKKEQDHGFSDARLIPLGILSPELFLSLTKLGYMPKDPGAGVEHGEFTHRLQWHAIMQQFEKDIKIPKNERTEEQKWNYTPFELFTKIGERDYNIALDPDKKGEKSNLLWAYLMDLQGDNSDEGFRHPDTMTIFFKTDAKAGNESQLPTLSAVVANRHKKRLDKKVEKAEAHGKNMLENRNPLTVGEELAAKEYKEKKTTQDKKYQLYDSEKPEEKLIIGVGDQKMTMEEVEYRRAETRDQFGLELSEKQTELLRKPFEQK